MRAPDFLVIGAARSGTTTLHRYFVEHPEIGIKKEKRPEPHFFLKIAEYSKGFEYYCHKYFEPIANHKIVGEVSTSYLYQPGVAERIKMHLPDVQMITVLRNPIERALSGYRHTVANGLEDIPFEEAVFGEVERIRDTPAHLRELAPYAYIDRGRYYEQLERYLRHFPQCQIKIVLFDDLVADPISVCRGVFSFLRVDPDYIPASVGVALNASAGTPGAIPASVRRHIGNVLGDDLRRLEVLLGRDLSSWGNYGRV